MACHSTTSSTGESGAFQLEHSYVYAEQQQNSMTDLIKMPTVSDSSDETGTYVFITEKGFETKFVCGLVLLHFDVAYEIPLPDSDSKRVLSNGCQPWHSWLDV